MSLITIIRVCSRDGCAGQLPWMPISGGPHHNIELLGFFFLILVTGGGGGQSKYFLPWLAKWLGPFLTVILCL